MTIGASIRAVTKPSASPSYVWYVVGILMFAYIVSFIDRLILGLLIQPIKEDLGVSDTQIGLLAGVGFALFYTIMGVPLARLADRANRKWLIIAGVALWSVMTAASAFATTYTGLLIARIGVGVGEATLTPAATSMIVDYFARDRVAKALGVYSMGLYLGSGIALLTGSVVVRAVTAAGPISIGGLGPFNAWQLAFLLASLPGLLVVALMLSVREPPRRELAGDGDAVPAAVPLHEVFAFLRLHRSLLTAHFAGYGLLGTAVTAYLIWTPEMLRRTYDIPIAQAALIYGGLLVTFGTIGPYLGGYLAQRLAARGYPDAELRVSIGAAIILTPLIAIAPLMPTIGIASMVLVPVVLLLAVPQGLAPAVLQLIAPNRMRGQVLAAFILMAVIFAYTIGPTAVPLCARWIFGSEQALDKSLALVCGILVPLAAISLMAARKRYRELMIASGRTERSTTRTT